MMPDPLVRVEDLQKWFPIQKELLAGLLGRAETQYVKAVDGVDFELARGEVLGLAGESGAGKSTIGRLLLHLTEPTGGRVIFDGIDLSELSSDGLRTLRKRMQVVFQDPLASLHPKSTIGDAILYPAKLHLRHLDRADQRRLAVDVLRDVGLDPPEQFFDKYPHQISGGQRQRVVIARALVTTPDLLVLDEPIASADVSVQVLLLDLLNRLKEEHGLTYLYITHDLGTAKAICDRIAILYLGRIVEIGPVAQVFDDPLHPYTRALLSAVPSPDPLHRRSEPLPRGEIPDPINPPPGCRFHPRCPIARTGLCDVDEPQLLPKSENSDHVAACFLTTGKLGNDDAHAWPQDGSRQ